MTILAVYLLVAALTLALAVLLVCQGRKAIGASRVNKQEPNTKLLDDSWLDQAQRIFDPADFYRLRDEVGSPELARDLFLHRKALALRWLRSLRGSFNELVHESRSTDLGGNSGEGLCGWIMAFHTLRIHLMLSYAMLVVWMFGPYTRLTPSFGWWRALWRSRSRKGRYESAKAR